MPLRRVECVPLLMTSVDEELFKKWCQDIPVIEFLTTHRKFKQGLKITNLFHIINPGTSYNVGIHQEFWSLDFSDLWIL